MKRTLAAQIVRGSAVCLVLLGITSGAALPQTVGSKNPGTAPAEPPAPAADCLPIGLTVSGEIVFPFQCKDFIERQKNANPKNAAEGNPKPTGADHKRDAAEEKTAAKQSPETEAIAEVKPVTAERKPAVAEGRPAAVEEKTAAKQQGTVVPENGKPATETVGSVPLPKREARERRIGPPGCTHFRSYNPASGTYETYDRQRHQCREVMSTAIATKAAPPAFRIPPDSSKAPQSAGSTAAVDANTASANIADSRSTADVNTRKIEAHVAAATTLAEHLTVATAVPPPDMKGINTDEPDPARGNAEKTASAPANATDLLVAVLMARPDITSVSGLTGKTIAIDDRYSAAKGNVRIAIVAAGAPEIELSGGQATAISRLINGEVPAAILALVSAEAAEGFPEIAGFKILRIPLLPRS
jgi:hypothetical protein